MKNKGFYIISFIILSSLISFIFVNETRARKNAQIELSLHASVIAESLWNFDRKAPMAYVEQAIRNNSYEKFTIKTNSGKVLLSSGGSPIATFWDSIFDRLGLIPALNLSQKVIFNKSIIGKIEIVVRIKTIYTNLYASFTGLLSFLVLNFFFTVLRSNKELDFRVRERTAKLEEEIRERKKIGAILQESEEKFRLIFENSPMALVHIDEKGIVTTCNDNACKILGSSKEKLIGLDTLKNLKDENMKTAISTALSGKNSYFKGEYLPVTGSLSPYLEAYFGPIYSIDRSLLGTIGVLADITKRKRAENELVEEKAFTDKVVNSMPGIFYAFNEEWQLIKWNKNLEELLGKSSEEITHKDFNLFDYVYGEDKEKVLKEIKKAKRTGLNISIEVQFFGKDGSKIPMFCTASYMNIGENVYLLGVGINISDKKKLEADLQQSQKMEAIGNLAGGIAHDFNNILSAILGYTELAREETDNAENLRKDLDEVYKGAGRAKELVKQILTFSRKDDQELVPTKIQFVIKEALKLIRSSIPATIEIKQDIQTDCDAVLANPTKIHQVIMNLCTNSYHAMREKGGVLGVSLKSVELTSDYVDNKINLSKGKYVKLEVSDTGSGIPKEEQNRIFEPYYTTKPKGEGTGLGLAVIHGIISNFNGDITLYSEIDVGTTFRIYLPVVETVIETIRKKKEGQIPTGNESIMVVDDDVTIAKLNTKLLRKLGYRVNTFTSSVEALKKFEQTPDNFDLIITDMTMPYITGAELGRNVLAIKPNMKIIMCTGFSDLINEDKARAIGISDYIMKPVTMNDLAVCVRSALDGK